MKKYIPIIVIILFLSEKLQAQVPQIKWWYDVFDSSFGQSAAGDIDKDGKLEIVFGCYRNDSSIYALNAENGTLLWRYNAHVANAEGCNDVAIAMYDVDKDDTLEVIVPSSCNPKTFCFRGKTGAVLWQTSTAGSDSPPTIADINNDGKEEILHGGFNGHVLCMQSETGSVLWDKEIFANSWVQTAPTVVDLNGDGQLDFVVGTWAFSPDTSKLYAYSGSNQSLLWSKPVSDYIYHGTAVADIDKDGKPELIFGDYNGVIYALNGEDGSLLWQYQASVYVGSPITIADVNHDGNCDIIFCDGFGVGVLDKTGSLLWYYTIPKNANSFRGVAVGDINGDNSLDIVFGTGKGDLIVLNGYNGSVIWDLDLAAHIGKEFDINHAPLIADFDQDGKIDIFIVGGKTDYPNFQTNYGRAYMITAGVGNGPEWLMFQHDLRRKSSMCDAPLSDNSIHRSQATFTLYPNPTSEYIDIQSEVNGDMNIYNSIGQIIKYEKISINTKRIDVSSLPIGLYYVSLKTSEGNQVQKIIKK
jgi:outer membrane protein assembly factor BamB